MGKRLNKKGTTLYKSKISQMSHSGSRCALFIAQYCTTFLFNRFLKVWIFIKISAYFRHQYNQHNVDSWSQIPYFGRS